MYPILISFIWIYSGFSFISLTIDNSNIGFILLTLILFPIINWIAEFETKNNQYIYLLYLLFLLLFLCFLLNSLVLFFICYEFIIILLFLVLFIFIPSFYRIRTAFFFFLFSIFGSMFFILSLFTIISSISLFSLLIIIPFLIKIPVFPFYYWLPEVHCEANTSISLFLAGLLLKLSLFGIIRFILSTFYLSLRFLSSIFIFLILIGILIINCSFFRYYDCKKIIALSSILHLNICFFAMLSLNSCGIYSAIVIALSHSLSSIGLFLFFGLVITKSNTRFIDSLFFISSTLRFILLFLLLSNNSFPGSINFIGEILIFTSVISIDVIFVLFLLVLSFLSTFFWFIILNRKLPYNNFYLQFHNVHILVLVYIIYFIYSFGLFLLFFQHNVVHLF